VQPLKIGREQVTGFHMAGDLLGTDAIGSEMHGCDAIALQDSHVCAIAYSQIEP
jgi:CRP/FNR family transcriptional regulator